MFSLYNAIFHSRLQYEILAWSATYKSYHNKTASLQKKKTVKIIGGRKWNDRATHFYAKLNIIELDEQIYFQKSFFLFKYKSHNLACIFNNYFIYASNTHEKYTRNTVSSTFCFITEITSCKNHLNINALEGGS